MSLPLGGGALGAPPVPMGGSAEDQGVKAVRCAPEPITVSSRPKSGLMKI